MVLQDLDVISFAYSPSSSMIVRLLIAPQTTPRFHTNLTIGPDPNRGDGPPRVPWLRQCPRIKARSQVF